MKLIIFMYNIITVKIIKYSIIIDLVIQTATLDLLK